MYSANINHKLSDKNITVEELSILTAKYETFLKYFFLTYISNNQYSL